MGYYYGAGDCRYGKGDYYTYVRPRGDYYRGDPGLFDFIKKIGGAIIKRSPFGLAAEAAKSVLPIFSRPSSRFDPATQGLPNMLPMVPPPQGPIAPGGGLPLPAQPALYCGPQGWRAGRMNKSTYITRGGGTSRWPATLMIHPKGTECVRPRRMNVANPRALRRALRRAQGFAKLARRYVAVQRKFKKGKRRARR